MLLLQGQDSQARNPMFSNDIAPLPPFAMWIKVSIASVNIRNGEIIDKDMVHMSMPLTLEAMSYRFMYAYGNHTCVSSAKEQLRTNDCGVVTTFEQECISDQNDQIPNLEKLEYICQVEKI